MTQGGAKGDEGRGRGGEGRRERERLVRLCLTSHCCQHGASSAIDYRCVAKVAHYLDTSWR